MTRLLLLTLLALSFGCSPKISAHFQQNTYVQNYNIQILNPSLEFAIETPADITYTTDKKELRKVIRKADFNLKDPVLIYGKTDEPPYEYFVTVSTNQKQPYPKNLIVFDTLINSSTIRFIGNPLHEDSNRALGIDLKNIFKSLKIGEGYLLIGEEKDALKK
jgi:hypothetical protein